MHILATSFIALIMLAFAATASAQEADPPAETVETASESAPPVGADGDDEDAGAGDADEFDDADLDLQTYDEDDDDFVPTEEVPADEAIPFPSDI